VTPGTPGAQPLTASYGSNGRYDSIAFRRTYSEGSAGQQRDQSWQEFSELIFQRKSKEIKDSSEAFGVGILVLAVIVATCCGVSAFFMHTLVKSVGCFSGINGCEKTLLLDLLHQISISQPLSFVITASLSGLLCSLIIEAPFYHRIASKCRGGGSQQTKMIVASGQCVSACVPVLRLVLTVLYLGGGNTLGTEGPIIHLSCALATWLVTSAGYSRRKTLSIFSVVGAAAGISAGFNVLITGFVYTMEELTRSLSQKVALIIIFAATLSFFVGSQLDEGLRRWLPFYSSMFTTSFEPLLPQFDRGDASNFEATPCVFLCVPIGMACGFFGWIFVLGAWNINVFLNPGLLGNSPSWARRTFLPKRGHLLVVGLVTGCVGAAVFQVTGENGVWGTGIEAVHVAIEKELNWHKIFVMFIGKFSCMILAVAAGGPGGMLLPALVCGGLLGTCIARAFHVSAAVVKASGIVGMGSLFAVVMHMPLTSIIMIAELSQSNEVPTHKLLPPLVVAVFIAMNITTRLPQGHQSYVHTCLEHDPIWIKVGKNDFIETDDQEKVAHDRIGFGRIYAMKTTALKMWFLSHEELCQALFIAWRRVVRKELELAKKAKLVSPRERIRVLKRSLVRRSLQLVFSEGANRLFFDAWVYASQYAREWFAALSPRRNRTRTDRGFPGLTPRKKVKVHGAPPDILAQQQHQKLLTTPTVPEQAPLPVQRTYSGGGSFSHRDSEPPVMNVKKSVSERRPRRNDPFSWVRTAFLSRRYGLPASDAGRPLLDVELGPSEVCLTDADRYLTGFCGAGEDFDIEVRGSMRDADEGFISLASSLRTSSKGEDPFHMQRGNSPTAS